MNDWTLLDTFLTQSEARVVESFLRAQGIETQLLDTHTSNLLPTPIPNAGLRLLVREQDLEQARRHMKNAAATSHLSIVGEEGVPPPLLGRTDQIIIGLLVLLGLVVWLSLQLKPA